MRQVVLDTETTGLETSRGHRIIEIGCVELLNRRASGRHYHSYLNPEREVDDGARAVHGMSLADLAGRPRFAEIVDELIAFISGAELIIHNASFDVGFLDTEFLRLAREPVPRIDSLCTVLDTLGLAREMHPGQRNNLDALCKRYGIDNSHRELHGALLDARILADVYLAMTGGQSALALDDSPRRTGVRIAVAASSDAPPLLVVAPTAEELAAHEQMQELLHKESHGHCLWRSS
ncbi:MAG: DNA polymerase III subunit epsilon [Steroidobacteraceae bacterium]